jgi:hypothetical protein
LVPSPLSFTNHDLSSRHAVPVRSSNSGLRITRSPIAFQLSIFVFTSSSLHVSDFANVDRGCTTEGQFQALGFLELSHTSLFVLFNCNPQNEWQCV